MSTYKKLLTTAFLITSTVFTSHKKEEFLYDQLLPKVINLNIENPTEETLHEINTGQAYLAGGTKFKISSPEIWQAVCSIDLFTILNQYMPTKTVSGKIALARLASFMNDDFNALQNKISIQKYFENNPNIYKKFNEIVSAATQEEKNYAHLFTAKSDEEKTELESQESHLYFSSTFGLDSLNENEYALGAGPRLNQLFTAASYIIPSIFTSAIYNEFNLGEKINTTKKQALFLLNTKANSYSKYKDELELLEKVLNEQTKDNASENFISKASYYLNELELNKLKISKNEFDELLKIKNEFLASSFYHGKESFNPYSTDFHNFFSQKYNYSEKSLTLCNNTDEFIERYKDGTSFADKLRIIARFCYNGTTNLPKTLYDGASIGYKATKEELTNGTFIYNNIKDFHDFKNDSSLKFYSKVGTVYSIIAASVAAYPAFLYWRYNKTKTLFDLIYKKQEEVCNVAQLVLTLEKLHNALEEDSYLKKTLAQDAETLGNLFNPHSYKTSSDLKHLIEKLRSNSFTSDPSYFISQPGKILATHKLLTRIKHELVPYLEVLGNIDAYLATHQTYLNFKHHPRVRFCLPEFISSPTPVLDITNYWHPLINPNTVVTNSLSMGTGNIKNLMITGPNAGGKTTSLMSLIINIIFAQSFGIAPSEKLAITPFAKIHSYLDITTDLQAGLSLFAAEVDRAKKLKQSILSCTGNQKTFTIIDEIFSGTAPDVASDVGSKFAAQLGDVTHSMTIITTHFPELTKVGQDTGTFTNYKVADATIMPDGKVVYPFKLVPGVSTQNIAQHMLEQEDVI